jgi:ribonuclease BN (tRNA processing enzyme)
MHGLLLGSGGGLPSMNRATCSALFVSDGHGLLIDAGSGLSYLVTRPTLLADVDRLDVVLTHFHLDHIVGLSALPSVRPARPVAIGGPGRLLYGGATADLLTRVLTEPFLAKGWDLKAIADTIYDLPPDGELVGPFSVTWRIQRHHSAPTLALKINEQVAYCTDTGFDQGNIEFARGCRTLVHEAWWPHHSAATVAAHSSAAEAALIAARASVANLILIHIDPLSVDEDLLAAASAGFSCSKVGADLMAIPC